jgi:hypothetical protein
VTASAFDAYLTRSLQKFINVQRPVASDAIGTAYFHRTSASPALGQVNAPYVEEVPVPVFLLTPVSENLTDHAWALSWHVGPVKIAASSADAARRLAAGQYTMAAYPEGQFIAGRSPWLEPDLVTIAPLVDGRTL